VEHQKVHKETGILEVRARERRAKVEFSLHCMLNLRFSEFHFALPLALLFNCRNDAPGLCLHGRRTILRHPIRVLVGQRLDIPRKYARVKFPVNISRIEKRSGSQRAREARGYKASLREKKSSMRMREGEVVARENNMRGKRPRVSVADREIGCERYKDI